MGNLLAVKRTKTQSVIAAINTLKKTTVKGGHSIISILPKRKEPPQIKAKRPIRSQSLAEGWMCVFRFFVISNDYGVAGYFATWNLRFMQLFLLYRIFWVVFLWVRKAHIKQIVRDHMGLYYALFVDTDYLATVSHLRNTTCLFLRMAQILYCSGILRTWRWLE